MNLSETIHSAIDFYAAPFYHLKKRLLRDGKEHPFALICPGGGYLMVCLHHEGMPLARKLNKEGFHVFLLSYRCAFNARYPHPQEDLDRALRTIFENREKWHIDMTSYSLWGFSAGGHLVSSFCAETDFSKKDYGKPHAIVLSYPVVTMGKKTHKDSQRRLLGRNPDSALVDHLSVEKHITKDYPRTFLWWGEDDDEVDPENSLLLKKALDENKVENIAISYPGVKHGVSLGLDLPCRDWSDRAIAFVRN